MKILNRVVIIVVLTVSYFMVADLESVRAQTSCPERDACRDIAYNNYINGVANANQAYLSCEQNAANSRNVCLDNAEQGKSYCEYEANMAFENVLARCSAIGDPYGQEYCIQEIESIRQQALSGCSATYDNSVQQCWWSYGGDVQGCEIIFYGLENAAMHTWDIERSACDQLCY
jgi:hypothetical protein